MGPAQVVSDVASAVAGVYFRTFFQLAIRLWGVLFQGLIAAASVDVKAAAGDVMEGAQRSIALGNITSDAVVEAVKGYPSHVAGNLQRQYDTLVQADMAAVMQWMQQTIVRNSRTAPQEEMQADLASVAVRVVVEEYLPALIFALFVVLLGYFWIFKRPGHALIDDDFLSFFSFANGGRRSLRISTKLSNTDLDSSAALSPNMEDFMQDKDQIKKRALAKAAIIKANSSSPQSFTIRTQKRANNAFDIHRKGMSGYKSSKMSDTEYSTGYSVMSASSIGGESMISDLSSVHLSGDLSHDQVMAHSLVNARVLENWEVEIEGYGKGVILRAKKIKFMSTKFVVRFPDNSQKTLALRRSEAKGKIPFNLLRKVA